MEPAPKVRIDKWLWAVRIFKTRTLAADACKTGKIKVNGIPAKPAQMIQVGDIIGVKKNNFNLVYKVIQLIEKRVSAALAEPCYQNHTPEEELNKYKVWFLANTVGEYRDKGSGRPTKKDRRELDDFKDGDELEEAREEFYSEFVNNFADEEEKDHEDDEN